MNPSTNCPYCGDKQIPHITAVNEYKCDTLISKGGENTKRSQLCRERERLQASQAEVERLKDIIKAHFSIDHIVQLRNEIAKLKEGR